MQQLYAKIKKNSKYFYQNEQAKQDGDFPFPVFINNTGCGSYCVNGNHGEDYRLKDVNLFVVDKGKEIRIK